ncbi:hypothetical protein HMPREF3226_01188 [Prevotella corporis]|uniref:Uncharacterized protein n=1 Tax=Prevotella corporis TaxID=28128 RepID=A0A133Q9S9_9BACT|nr:hypothetical protein HMPREF3226_01188 [Prevotella corporis]
MGKIFLRKRSNIALPYPSAPPRKGQPPHYKITNNSSEQLKFFIR